MNQLVDILISGGYTLVVRSADGIVSTYNRRGVADLYELLTSSPETLRGACIADKVIGKAAAALMILGGCSKVHTATISTPALGLFKMSQVEVTFDNEVPHIINRTNTGWCPLETRCFNLSTPQECFDAIKDFIESSNNVSNK